MKRTMESPLLEGGGSGNKKKSMKIILFVLAFMALTILGFVIRCNRNFWAPKDGMVFKSNQQYTFETELGVVATDHSRCSEIGASILRRGGHAVDAAVATSLCLGIIYATSSGIGGGAFMVVRSSATSRTQAFDMRETAPLAASQFEFNSFCETIAAVKPHISMGPVGRNYRRSTWFEGMDHAGGRRK